MGVLGEAWDLNLSHEWLVDGAMSVWWSFVDRAALVVVRLVMRLVAGIARS
jgi:hypothetical protein